MLYFPFGFIWLYLSRAAGSHYAFPCVSRNLSNIWDLCCWKLLSGYPPQLSFFLIKWIELLVPRSKAFSPTASGGFVILSSPISKRFLATFEKCICESCYQHTGISLTRAVWSYKLPSPYLCMWLKTVLDTDYILLCKLSWLLLY